MIAVIAFCSLFLIPTVMAIWSKFYPEGIIARLGHAAFGWHNGRLGPTTFDGCSQHARCSLCGRAVMQDSQGNWFTFGGNTNADS